jgi:hypothetical protein
MPEITDQEREKEKGPSHGAYPEQELLPPDAEIQEDCPDTVRAVKDHQQNQQRSKQGMFVERRRGLNGLGIPGTRLHQTGQQLDR